MNLYVLDEDPTLAAQMLHDRDLVRGVHTCAQLLHEMGNVFSTKLARWVRMAHHESHPPRIARRTWLYHVANAYCKEYAYRYGRAHKHASELPTVEMPVCQIRDLVEAYPCFIPRGYLQSGSDQRIEAVAAHRRYYLLERRRYARYTRRAPPTWLAAALKQPPTLPIVTTEHLGHLVGIPVKIEPTQVRVSLYDPTREGMPAVGDAPLVVRYNGTCMSDDYSLARSGMRVLKEIRSYA